MIKPIAVLLLLAFAAALKVEVNNIHVGYRNIYLTAEYSLTGSRLALSNYKLTKEELTSDNLGFITAAGTEVIVDLDLLVRQFEVEEIDPSAPLLTFRFLQKPSIVITIHSESHNQNEIQVINMLALAGRDPSVLDL